MQPVFIVVSTILMIPSYEAPENKISRKWIPTKLLTTFTDLFFFTYMIGSNCKKDVVPVSSFLYIFKSHILVFS